MATRKTTAKRKTTTRRKTTATRAKSGLTGYRRFLNSDSKVKLYTKRVKEAESKLKAAKKDKASAVKAAQKKYKAKTR